MAEHPRSAEDLLDSEEVAEFALVLALLDLDADLLVVPKAPDEFSEGDELLLLLERPLQVRLAVLHTCSGDVLCPPESLEVFDLFAVPVRKWLQEGLAVRVVLVVVGRDVDCGRLDFGVLTVEGIRSKNLLVPLYDVLHFSLHSLSLVALSHALLVGYAHVLPVRAVVELHLCAKELSFVGDLKVLHQLLEF